MRRKQHRSHAACGWSQPKAAFRERPMESDQGRQAERSNFEQCEQRTLLELGQPVVEQRAEELRRFRFRRSRSAVRQCLQSPEYVHRRDARGRGLEP